ncbi:Phosphatidylinositol 4-kinase beta 1 [Sesamum alatum]|uniref:Phosphatidylinositol 4-kinase beta 1 n=1 Tax=Sesamum alatum TaxID=300844 RepID=A0AAE1XRJ4_9LAMI|nr:Phosphatidylinositol 4-kinase beta 1 [Sesamum alatum]
MVRLLGLTRAFGEWAESPREVTRTIPTSESIGESGWLIRFFDSAFFCEWIAVSYLYKHDHPGVRDYLCNRMYTLPLPGIESYLFQICYMLIHKPSPSLDKFVIDICSRSLKIALKVHWFLMAELEDVDDNEGISRIQEKCQFAATLMGEWPPLIKPQTRSSILHPHHLKLLSLTSSPPSSASAPRSFSFSPSSGNSIVQDDSGKVMGSPEESNKIFKKFIPGPKVRDALLFRKSVEKEDEEPDKDGGFFRKLLKDSRDEDVRKSVDKDKENEEEPEKEGGFFKRLLRDSRDEEVRKSVDKDKENDEEPEKEGGFFKRLLRDNRDEDARKSVGKDKENDEEHEKGRLLSGSRDEDVRQSIDKDDEESDKDGFFRRLLSSKDEEEEVSSSTDGFFKRLFRDTKNDSEEKVLSKAVEDDEKEGFFKKFFKDKFEDKKDGSNKNDDVERETKSSEEDDKEGFFKKLFKEKNDEKKDSTDRNDEDRKGHANGEDEEPSDFMLFRRLFRVHPEDSRISTGHDNSNVLESSPGTENFFRKLFKDR